MAPTKSKTQPRPDLWIYAALLIAIVAIYAQVSSHDFVDYDDNAYIVDNPHVRDGLTGAGVRWAFTSLEQSNWFPLTWLSHMVDVQLFGLDPGAHHLVNLAFHILTTLILFAVFKRMTGARWPSAFVALGFGLHPLHVESVAWIAERKDVLSALFWTLTIGAYYIYTQRPDPMRYLAVTALIACALMSKPMAVTLPFVLLLLDYWPLGRLKLRAIFEKLPWIALSIVASVIAYVAQQRSGAVAIADHLPLAARLENALVSYAVYLEKFIWPSNLAVFYPYTEPSTLAWIAASVAVVTITVLALRRPYLTVGWLWYLGTLVPVIGLVQVGSQSRADRYMYLPLIGICIMIAWGAAEFIRNRRVLIAGATAVAAIWSIVTWRNLQNWQDSETLFVHALQSTDNNFVAYNNLGYIRRRQGRFEEAASNFANAVRIQPESLEAQDNLGEALTTLGKSEEAIPHLTAAVRLRPDLAKPHIDLGSALMRSGRPEQALAEFQQGLRLDPQNTDAEYRIGGVLMMLGHRDEAMPHFERAVPAMVANLQRNPGDVDGHFNLGEVYGLMGRDNDAASEFSAAIRLRPDDAEAHFNLGVALMTLKQFDPAAQQFATAARLRPDFVNAHLSLARALAALDRKADAIAEYTETLRLAPDLEEARNEMKALNR